MGVANGRGKQNKYVCIKMVRECSVYLRFGVIDDLTQPYQLILIFLKTDENNILVVNYE